MKTKQLIGVIITTIIYAGCLVQGSGLPGPVPPDLKPDLVLSQLKTFSDDTELQDYLLQVDAIKNSDSSAADAETTGVSSEPAADAASSGNNAEITNNQESGVDEGGLVKNYKDLLIILRRGRLVTVQVGENGSLKKIDQEEVTPAGLDNNVWYDELLVHENRAIVIGYRYGVIPNKPYKRSATELNFFEISEEGSLSRLKTFFIESNDYYSWKNYAGRLLNGKLILYTPYASSSLLDSERHLQMPQLYIYEGEGKLTPQAPLFRPTDIFKPIQETSWPVLHSILICDLEESSRLDCEGKAFVASWPRELYISENHAYLFAGKGWSNNDKEANLLYSLSLDLSTSGVVQVKGFPLDQFSFSESEDGIDLLLMNFQRTSSGYEAKTTLTQIPFDAFDDLPSSLSRQKIIDLGGKPWVNRFSPTHLALGGDKFLTIVNRGTQEVTRLDTGMVVQRLELAGNRFVAIGPEGDQFDLDSNLRINLVDLDNTPKISDSITVPFFEGEWRSHGYAYHEGEFFDTFGLATQSIVEVGSCLEDVSSPDIFCWDGYEIIPSISFFNIDTDGSIEFSQTTGLQAFNEPSESCTTSCADWYGNTRPIFLEGRVFGLIGDELSSGMMDQDRQLKLKHHLNIFTGELL